MPNQKLGVTANELFACNPFRILGVPVTAEDSYISSVYKDLLAMAGTAQAETYKTPFDFDSLPPFKRDELTLRTAYAKLASNGYRCFAYSDGEFTQALNIDDVMLNLSDINSYDVFLRCYMWLIVNDRSFEEPELWVPLAKYIDMMISSGPDQWARLFDNRFPQSLMARGGQQLLAEFHSTFKDIILLPIKEMVRGSMRCTSAIQILKTAKVDVDEQFPVINIPQANRPAPGQSAPKLKLASKGEDEYFDVNQGRMVESNTFAAAASAISAAAIVGEAEPEPKAAAPVQSAPKPVAQAPAYEEEPAPVQSAPPTEERKVSLVDDHIASQMQSGEAKHSVSMVEEEPEVKHVEAIDTLAPRVRPKTAAQPEPPKDDFAYTAKPSSGSGGISFPSENTAGKLTINASPDEYAKPKEEPKAAYYTTQPADDMPSANVGSRSLEAIDPFATSGGTPRQSAPAQVSASAAAATGTAKRRSRSLSSLDGLGEADVSQAAVQMTFSQPTGARRPEPVVEEPAAPQKNVTERRTLTHLIEDVDSATDESANQLLTEQEIEDELYTDTLIKLLRSNRSSKMMMDVDTEHVFINGGETTESNERSKGVTMDEINPNKIDVSSLDSAYDGTRRIDESDPNAAAAAIKAKYKNINIDDMINPTVGGKLNREYHPDAIKEYVKEKQAEKKLYGSIGKLIALAAFVALLVAFLWFFIGG